MIEEVVAALSEVKRLGSGMIRKSNFIYHRLSHSNGQYLQGVVMAGHNSIETKALIIYFMSLEEFSAVSGCNQAGYKMSAMVWGMTPVMRTVSFSGTLKISGF